MFATILRNRFAQITPLVVIRQTYHCTTKKIPSFDALQSSQSKFISPKIKDVKQPLKHYSVDTSGELDALKFNEVCCETLESLCDYFEEIVESNQHLKNSDVVYGDGVLTVVFGKPYGTYVINRQTPNKQIWLSSPTSGPKRYDFVDTDNGHWIYKHTGESLHTLLQDEISKIVKTPVDFSSCSFSLV